ncbi:MAG TPA: hypothetical protein VGB96_16500 [Archangium sp.]
MFTLITLAAATAVTVFGYIQARRFVRNRLRFVDKVHGGAVPALVGAAAMAVALPVTWIVPFVGFGTALLFGIGVGSGVAAGRSDIRHNRIGSGS